MRQDERAYEALQAPASSAFATGEFVGQQSFMSASEIREIAQRAGVGAGVSVLDLCCGVAGPGRLITAEFGCAYLGVDRCADAVEIAQVQAGDLPCRFEHRDVPPLPDGHYDAILLLETLLAFPDKASLFKDVAATLRRGGRFAFTLEEGRPLTPDEQRAMPDADTVWPIELEDLELLLGDAGLSVTWEQDCTASHLQSARALLHAYRTASAEISRTIGPAALSDLITAHDLWCSWLQSGRVRKYAVVATLGSAS